MGGSIGVGIIGTGKHGSRYARHIVEDFGSHFHLAAISRRSAAGQDQALAWDTTLYGDWRDLVRASEVEAVISAVTPNLNGEIGELRGNGQTAAPRKTADHRLSGRTKPCHPL
jgi:predicted dehydrogenase